MITFMLLILEVLLNTSGTVNEASVCLLPTPQESICIIKNDPSAFASEERDIFKERTNSKPKTFYSKHVNGSI